MNRSCIHTYVILRPPLFGETKLRELAGDKVFARGQGDADHGQIALLIVNGDGFLAAAYGTSNYTIWLNSPGREISGHCSCPAFEDSGFCKHLVATALVTNERGDEVPDRVGEIAGSLARLDKPQLDKLLLEMVASDWRALRSLCFALDFEWDDDFD
ncbi:SWIM-type domain-containing protein [Novosphingobium lubricantis]|jgi:uncharacterized Zn finger protein